jgi:hypothetical protein
MQHYVNKKKNLKQYKVVILRLFTEIKKKNRTYLLHII